MPKDIFISYAKGDREWADQVCEQLEQAGIECWIAPRDIAPGVTWPAAITEAIAQCRAMIVVFSRHANESRQMAREVEVADSRHVPILPVRVEEIEPAGDMEYFLGNRQWFDLHTQKVERKRALPAAIASLLGQLESTGITPGPAAPAPVPAKRSMPVWIPLAGVAAVGALAAAVLMYSGRGAGVGQPAAAASTPPPAVAEVAAPQPPPQTAVIQQQQQRPAPPPRQPSPKPEASAAATLPPIAEAPKPAAAAAATGAFEGKWEAEVKYSWGITRKETFTFKVDDGDVLGMAGYLGTPRGILDGKVTGNKISFTTKSQSMVGSQTYDEKHVYRGRLSPAGDAIEFILQTDSGYDSRPPEMFSARRLE